MLKSTGIKILNVYIQTGVLLSVAYPFFFNIDSAAVATGR